MTTITITVRSASGVLLDRDKISLNVTAAQAAQNYRDRGYIETVPDRVFWTEDTDDHSTTTILLDE